MTLFSFTYIHPHTGQPCTVDSGKPTQAQAFHDIVRYMRGTGLGKLAPRSASRIKDEILRTVGSSHGELTIDARGNILNRKLDNADSDGGDHLAVIIRFNLREWKRYWGAPLPMHFDILDLGYWYTNPDNGETLYEPPVADWRKDITEILLQRKSEKISANTGQSVIYPPKPRTFRRRK